MTELDSTRRLRPDTPRQGQLQETTPAPGAIGHGIGATHYDVNALMHMPHAKDMGLDRIGLPTYPTAKEWQAFLAKQGIEDADVSWLSGCARNPGACPRLISTLDGRRFLTVRHLGGGGFGKTFLLRSLDGKHDGIVMKCIDVHSAEKTRREVETALNEVEREDLALQLRGERAAALEWAETGKHTRQGRIFSIYHAGPTLAQKIRETGGLRPLEACRYILSAARDLEDTFRRHGLMHQDLKEDNMVATQEGLKLVDWGAMQTERFRYRNVIHEDQRRLAGYTVTQATPERAAEEVLRKGKASMQSQVASLGKVFLIAIAGDEPKAFGARSVTDEKFLEAVRQRCPPAAKKLLTTEEVSYFMNSDPAQRMTMQQFIEFLEGLLVALS